MPRKITSSGVPTEQRKTSLRRAMGMKGKSHKGGPVPDGGKWADGRKAVEHREGPGIVRQHQPGRGPKTRTAMRAGGANHPNHG